ncbi:MAG: TonB-dependent receptor [Novosphingobium sp.]
MIRRAFLVSALAPAIWSGHARAEDAPIVVTGQNSALSAPQAVRVVRLDEGFLLNPSGRIEDVLGTVPGLQQFRRADSRSGNPTAQGITLRALGGNASSRTTVLLDGVPMADPFFGSVPLSALTPDRLGRVTVWHGGGAGAFSEGAVAGTIELTSDNAREAPRFAGAALVDDRGDSEIGAALSARIGAGSAALSGRWDRGRGFWTTPAYQRVPASVRAAHESWSASLRSVAPLAPDVELQVRGLVYDDRRTLRFAGADSSSSGQDASVRMVASGRWKAEAVAWVQARNFSTVVVSSTSFRKTLDQYGTPSTGVGGRIDLRPPVGGGHDLRIGLSWRRGVGETQEAAISAASGQITARRLAGGAQDVLGFSLQDEWTLGCLTLSGGMRADRWRQTGGFFRETSAAGVVTADNRFAGRTGWQASWRARGAVKLGSDATLFAAAYTGLRLPTLNELYRPFTVFPVTTRANAALENERLRGFEAGLTWQPVSQMALALTAFDNKVEGAIANVTIGTNLRERRNVDAVHAQGLEASLRGWFGPVSLRAALAYTDARVEAQGLSVALNGMRPAQTARFSASGSAIVQPAQGWSLALILKHTGAQFEDDLQVDRLPAATTLGATVEAPLGRGLSLVLRGENLTGAEIVTRNQAGSIDLGAPRTVWAGVRVKLP